VGKSSGFVAPKEVRVKSTRGLKVKKKKKNVNPVTLGGKDPNMQKLPRLQKGSLEKDIKKSGNFGLQRIPF